MSRYVVTGAGSGIGEALATSLAARGDDLILTARNGARAAELSAMFPTAQVVVADLADPGSVNGLGREVSGPLDGVVHCAGVVTLGPVSRLRLGEWDEQLAVNLVAPAVLTRELLPQLRQACGTVVFVNSTAGLLANAEWAAYAATKAGLRAVADALRSEEKEHGVRVTTVFPSRTATPMQQRVHAQEGKEYDASAWISPEAVADAICYVLDLPVAATIPEFTMRTASA